MSQDHATTGSTTGPAAPRRRGAVLVAATAVLAVLATLLAVACVVVLVRPTAVPGESAAEKASDRDLAVQVAATRAMKAFLEVDYRDMEARIKKVEALSTGAFKNQYRTISVDLKTRVETAKTVATSAIRRVGVGDIDEDTAVVFVAADTEVSNTAIEQKKAAGEESADGKRFYRFQLTLKKVGDRWLVNDLQGIS
jgi:Mce-associated membrane protein